MKRLRVVLVVVTLAALLTLSLVGTVLAGDTYIRNCRGEWGLAVITCPDPVTGVVRSAQIDVRSLRESDNVPPGGVEDLAVVLALRETIPGGTPTTWASGMIMSSGDPIPGVLDIDDAMDSAVTDIDVPMIEQGTGEQFNVHVSLVWEGWGELDRIKDHYREAVTGGVLFGSNDYVQRSVRVTGSIGTEAVDWIAGATASWGSFSSGRYMWGTQGSVSP